MSCLTLFIVSHMGFYKQSKSPIISTVDLPTTEITEPERLN